jgi:hypothetical protein
LIESDSTLARFLKGDPAWDILYQDTMATVFARKGNMQ